MSLRTEAMLAVVLSVLLTGCEHDGQATGAVTSSEQSDESNFWNLDEAQQISLHGDPIFEFRRVPWETREPTPEEVRTYFAREILLHADQSYRDGRTEDAMREWDEIIAQFRETPAWYKAVLKSAGVLQQSGQHTEAIDLLLSLLHDSTHHERLGRFSVFYGPKPPTPLDAYLDLWNNDWHHACLMVVQSYESLRELAEARRYAVLARDKFYFRVECGNASLGEQGCWNDRIADYNRRITTRIAR